LPPLRLSVSYNDRQRQFSSGIDQSSRLAPMLCEKCPVYRSIYKAIEISTELLFEPLTSS
jgi:hypothetical protein